ncbi:MAG: gamma carbonic anhydrase family protein [Legionellales bacterium]|nr:gamma carbonic anhydrase family protein [Legionellales bacterium]|tara:strand:+ start:301 stop:831 length:531 start_codon:yes stop_codon:yes gene_type:complete
MKIRAYQDIKPILGRDVYVDETATVIGKVKIGDDCSIWPQAVLRGDVNVISIGQRTNIQDNSVLHVTHASDYTPEGRALIIGDDVTVGHQCVLHACTVGNLCLIGIGSIILDDVEVESQVMIGAGSLVPSGQRLERGYLYFGRPVKKIRQLTERELSFLQYSAENYVKLKQTYIKR